MSDPVRRPTRPLHRTSTAALLPFEIYTSPRAVAAGERQTVGPLGDALEEDMDGLMKKALEASRESKQVEFKQSLDPTSDAEWCEVVKDIVAIANSGGGVLVVGLDNKGVPSGTNVEGVLATDPADVENRLYRYTGVHFSDFEICAAQKGGVPIAVIAIRTAEYPIVFSKPGTYAVAGGKQKTAFAQGTAYFRHGAKSEPGVTEDIRRFVDRKLETIRREWLTGVRKVVTAPAGATIAVQRVGEVRVTVDPSAARIRIVDHPSAPAFRQVDPNNTHPFRQMDVIAQIKKELPSGEHFTSHDAVAVRRLHGVDGNPTFYYRPRFGSPQYSPEYVEWLRQQIAANPQFLAHARTTYSQQHSH